jgi:UDP-N-acetylmuramoylalanine--D-glutamate ligase
VLICRRFPKPELNFCLEYLLSVNDLKICGLHNVENALAALALCFNAGISPLLTVPAVKTFSTGHHRLETVVEHHGVVYINDSKATNPDALIQALSTVGNERTPILY